MELTHEQIMAVLKVLSEYRPYNNAWYFDLEKTATIVKSMLKYEKQ